MNLIWSIIVLLSIFYFIFSGNVIELNNVILNTSFDTLKSYGLIASSIILWSGILEVATSSNTIKYLTIFVKPFVKMIFKTKDDDTIELLSANITCNIFALGAASTPFALKALNKLKEESNGMESYDMSALLIINSCGFTLIPTSLLTLRSNFNSDLSALVIILIIIVSLFTTTVMLIINRLVKK